MESTAIGSVTECRYKEGAWVPQSDKQIGYTVEKISTSNIYWTC